MKVVVATLVLLAQGKPRLSESLSSKHYDLKTSGTREEGQELLDFMELVHQTYTALLKPENPGEVEKRKFTLVLFHDSEEYAKAGAPPGSGAYYNGKELVGWYDPTFMRPFFAHEGMHQFTDATSKNFRDFRMWFTEGIADCIGNCEVRDRKLYMCVKSGMIARMRLQLIQAAVRQGAVYPLRDLMMLPKTEFMRNAELCYAQSWSFCHFLITYPKEEDRSSQIPNGKFRKNLAMYYEAVRAGGTTHAKAWEEAFPGIPMRELEEAWKKYVLELDAGKFLGIAGKEVSQEEHDALGLDAGFTGILLDEVLPDGVAGRSGIRAGDVLVRFDGRRFPRHDAMNRLRVWMQDVPYGRAVKAVVLRGGAEMELSCKWDPPSPKK
ncbi:MAG TPA: PDZ domain-containing protein [Planctomycetota bacterium]|nr:PDZ domain-containing protein [Planctomycetota bacterium]